MGERASNLFGVLLSLTFFSVLLAVMLVAVSILPDGPALAPSILRGETRSRLVRTPQPATLAGLGLEPAPVLPPVGAGVVAVTPVTGVVTVAPPAAGPAEPGPGIVEGPPRVFGPVETPTGRLPTTTGGGQDAEKAKSRAERAAEKAKGRAEKAADRARERSVNGGREEGVQAFKPKPARGKGEGPPGGKGKSKGRKR